MNSTLMSAIGSARSVKLGLASVPESTSSWFKTVIDPAHAREYGCRGVPDENQQPTLVLSDRQTISISPGNVPKWYQPSGTGGDTPTTITDVYIIQSGIPGVLGAYCICGANSAGQQVWSQWIPLKAEVNKTLASGKVVCRTVAMSLTVDWVGTELYRGGYFEAAYLPPPSMFNTSAGSSDQTYLVDASNVSDLVSYTGSSDQGVYIIGELESYESYKAWKSPVDQQMSLAVTSSGGTHYQGLLDNSLNPYAYPSVSGFRTSVVHYLPVSSQEWVIRVTANMAVERFASPYEGGVDGSTYDRASVEAYIGLADDVSLIFPAAYNDLAKIIPWLQRNAQHFVTFSTSLLRAIPQAKTVVDALLVLLDAAHFAANVAVRVRPTSRAAKRKQLRRTRLAIGDISTSTAIKKRAK